MRGAGRSSLTENSALSDSKSSWNVRRSAPACAVFASISATGTVGDASKLVFTVQPGGGAAQVAWNLQPEVTL